MSKTPNILREKRLEEQARELESELVAMIQRHEKPFKIHAISFAFRQTWRQLEKARGTA